MSNTSNKIWKYSYWFIGLLLIIQQLRLLFGYSFRFTGSDQTVLWQMANDIGNGVLHAPYFYGQNYNFPLESWFAIPFLKLGVPYWIAFPIITALLYQIPFLILSRYFYNNKSKLTSLVCLGIPLLLPLEINLVSGLSRGFVTGIFAAGFLPLFLNKKTKLSYFLFAFFCALALVLNANSAIYFVPLAVFYGLKNIKTISFYFFSFLGLILPFALKYMASQFYQNHPEFNINILWGDSFVPETFVKAFTDLDRIFQFSIPLFWTYDKFTLVLLPLFAIVLFSYKKQKEAVSLLAVFAVILIALGLPKVHDGIGSIFLNTTRMWLAIPLLISVCLFWLGNIKINNKLFFVFTEKRKLIFVLFLLFGFFVFKQHTFDQKILDETKITDLGAVSIIKIKDLKSNCNFINEIAQKHKVTLVALVYDWDYKVSALEFTAYGCPLIQEHFKPTLLNIYERRNWRIKNENSISHQKILLIGWNDNEMKMTQPLGLVEKIYDSPRMYLVNCKEMNIKTTFEKLNIKYLKSK